MRGNISRSYRELLTLLKRLPNDAQSAAGKEAKHKILANRHETDSLKITDLHKQLIAKISFLRMTTTRRPGERARQASGTFVLRGADLVEAESAPEQRAIGNQVNMSDFKQRHHTLLKRQHFGRQPPASHGKLF
ncbi:hypothetical protein WJX79_008067 [Trebouxia sp. C0005]